MKSLRDFAGRLGRDVLGGGSLVNLAASRILLAGIVLYLDWGGRFYKVAWMPSELWQPIPMLTWLGIGQPSGDVILQLELATKIALAASIAGLFTNVSLLVAFVLQLVQEATLNSFGKVTHATIPLLYALLFFALSPCGRRLSVDALLRRLWKRGAYTTETHSPWAAWPLELLFIELAAFYFQAGAAKLKVAGWAWADGYTLQFYLLQKNEAAGVWLASHLQLCAALSVCVLMFELGFPLAVFVRRLRPWFLAGGLCFHLGTTYFMNVVFWPVWVLYPLFLPWERMLRRWIPHDVTERGRLAASPLPIPSLAPRSVYDVRLD